MPSKKVYFGLWLVGYVLGFAAYLAVPEATAWLVAVLPTLLTTHMLAGAFITGLATSIIATFSALLLSSSN
jgi:hypothetical protein